MACVVQDVQDTVLLGYHIIRRGVLHLVHNFSSRAYVYHELTRVFLNCLDDGVYTSKASGLCALTRLGPLEGVVCDESGMDFDEDRSHVWLLYGEDGRRRCISTADPDR